MIRPGKTKMSVKIYTKTGDEGNTGLFGGIRTSKDDARVEAYGTVDELNAAIGLVRCEPLDDDIATILETVQNALFSVGADLATPGTSDERRGKSRVTRLPDSVVLAVETAIDYFDAQLKPLTTFVLPGGCILASRLHWARVVCRRAERRVVTLVAAAADSGSNDVNPVVVRYLNRLSDLLFVLARYANMRAGLEDVPWTAV